MQKRQEAVDRTATNKVDNNNTRPIDGWHGNLIRQSGTEPLQRTSLGMIWWNREVRVRALGRVVRSGGV